MSAGLAAGARAPALAESSADDLEIQRHLLDLALQPLDRFDGFTRIDQWLEASLRYQLNAICFALAMAQYTRTPAFTGYLAEAQRNTVAKMLDRRVWGYWALENLLGHLRWDPDPIVRDNVMYSGYLGVMIGFHETLNDDRRYDPPGALTLRWDERRSYAYDLVSVAEAIRRNMLASPHTQYPLRAAHDLPDLQHLRAQHPPHGRPAARHGDDRRPRRAGPRRVYDATASYGPTGASSPGAPPSA